MLFGLAQAVNASELRRPAETLTSRRVKMRTDSTIEFRVRRCVRPGRIRYLLAPPSRRRGQFKVSE
jgi:hypothetical protein